MKQVNWCVKLAKWAMGAALVVGCADWVSGATGDWPQWRGPKRDNISTETGLLQDWPKEGPPLVWEIKGLGNGYSSLSVVGGKIFTMGSFPNDPPAAAEKPPEPKPEPKPEVKKDEPKDPKAKPPRPKRPPVNETTAVLAFDLAGKPLWKTSIGPTGDGGGHVGPRCTPTIDGDRVYALSDNGDLVCLAIEDGKEIWHINMKKDLAGQMMSNWGYAESVTIDADKLICCPGGTQGTVAALDKKTGAVIWRSKELTDSASYASLVPSEIGGAHQYVVFTNNSIAGIGTDGALLWRAERKGQTAVVPTPVVKDNIIYVTSGYGVGCNAFKIEGSAGSSLKAEAIYANKEMKVHHGGIIQIGDDVFGSSDPGLLTCMSLKDGSVIWNDRSVGKGSLAYADGRLYLRSEGSGDIALVEASHAGYKEHGILKQPHRSKKNAWPHLVIAGGKLYVRDQDILLCFDIKAK